MDRLLDERARDVTKVGEKDYEYLVNWVGHFSLAQLQRVLEEGTADHLRDIARHEITARAAASPSWTMWLSVAAIVAGLIASILQIADWLRARG